MGALDEAQAQAEELAKSPKDVFSAAYPSARAHARLAEVLLAHVVYRMAHAVYMC